VNVKLNIVIGALLSGKKTRNQTFIS